MSEEGGKLTLRRLEGPIHKFTKVALPTDLERLQRHHSNILKVTHTHTYIHTQTHITDHWKLLKNHTEKQQLSLLLPYSSSIVDNGIAFIRSTSMPAALCR